MTTTHKYRFNLGNNGDYTGVIDRNVPIKREISQKPIQSENTDDCINFTYACDLYRETFKSKKDLNGAHEKSACTNCTQM